MRGTRDNNILQFLKIAEVGLEVDEIEEVVEAINTTPHNQLAKPYILPSHATTYFTIIIKLKTLRLLP